ncbi:hypothetical protein [Metabacillus sp. 84]|uniref:hypothetical protein n=1 Tax=Metabacillus sp. 84 TaxID=3404705 RepID=UPI003CECBBE8
MKDQEETVFASDPHSFSVSGAGGGLPGQVVSGAGGGLPGQVVSGAGGGLPGQVVSWAGGIHAGQVPLSAAPKSCFDATVWWLIPSFIAAKTIREGKHQAARPSCV